jgi:hypothetical protein
MLTTQRLPFYDSRSPCYRAVLVQFIAFRARLQPTLWLTVITWTLQSKLCLYGNTMRSGGSPQKIILYHKFSM